MPLPLAFAAGDCADAYLNRLTLICEAWRASSLYRSMLRRAARASSAHDYDKSCHGRHAQRLSSRADAFGDDFCRDEMMVMYSLAFQPPIQRAVTASIRQQQQGRAPFIGRRRLLTLHFGARFRGR